MRPLALALLTTLAACQTAPVREVRDVAADVLLPPSQEKELGAQVAREIESQARLLDDPTVVEYVGRVGRKVAATSPNPDRWQFTFKVIDDPGTVNAFAIPGGTIYVYSGLIKTAQDEAQLAGVLAHEVAHQTSRHIARRMVDAYGLQLLASIALGKNPGMAAQIAASILAQGALLKNSRDDESEADSKGVVASSRAGYDPMAMVRFFELLKREQGEQPRVLTFLSDHPAPADRIRALKAEIARKNLTGGQANLSAFQAIQGRI